MNKKFTALCAAMLMCAILVMFYGNFVLVKNTPALADKAKSKVIYLTFDDGPSDRVTPKILDILQEKDVKATFFIIGKNAETRKYLIEREMREGHSVAVHSYTHIYNEIYSSPEALIADIDKCNDVIREITGKTSTAYRFPGGSYGLSQSLIRAVSMHGMRYVDWNASFRDCEIYNPTSEQLYKAAINTPVADDYIVMLAHDSTTKTTTAEALGDVIDYYKERGYVFATF